MENTFEVAGRRFRSVGGSKMGADHRECMTELMNLAGASSYRAGETPIAFADRLLRENSDDPGVLMGLLACRYIPVGTEESQWTRSTCEAAAVLFATVETQADRNVVTERIHMLLQATAILLGARQAPAERIN